MRIQICIQSLPCFFPNLLGFCFEGVGLGSPTHEPPLPFSWSSFDPLPTASQISAAPHRNHKSLGLTNPHPRPSCLPSPSATAPPILTDTTTLGGVNAALAARGSCAPFVGTRWYLASLLPQNRCSNPDHAASPAPTQITPKAVDTAQSRGLSVPKMREGQQSAGVTPKTRSVVPLPLA